MLLQQIDPNVPVLIPEEDLTAWVSVLDQVLGDILTPVTPPLLADGMTLWRGLATIMVVWTGLKIAYSGHFAPWDIVRLLMGLWFPWVMLTFYADPIPFTAFSFPMTVTAGANWLGASFRSDVVAVLQETLTGLVDTYQTRFATEWSNLNLFALLRTGGSALFTFFGGLAMSGTFILVLILIFAITMGQVVWAMIAISILIFLGPMFIPFMMVPPLSFLFWGWFRALFTYALYSVIAGALLRIWGGIVVGYVTTLSNTSLFNLDSLGWATLWLVALFPLLIASVLSALKVGELASTIVGGGGGGGSGALGLAGAAAGASGGGRLAATAVKGGAGGV